MNFCPSAERNLQKFLCRFLVVKNPMYNGLRIKEIAEVIWAKRSETFYPLLYDSKGKVAKQFELRARQIKFINFSLLENF